MLLQPIFAPIGFNWQICIALIPAMAAREVVVAALGTVYALSAVDEDAMAEGLAHLISGGGDQVGHWQQVCRCWCGLSMHRIVWRLWQQYVVKQVHGKPSAVMTVYLFGLAYLMSFLTYQIASRIFGLRDIGDDEHD